MKSISNFAKYLLLFLMFTYLSLTSSGCALLLIGGATGAYIYGQHLQKCQRCGKMVSENALHCPECGVILQQEPAQKK